MQDSRLLRWAGGRLRRRARWRDYLGTANTELIGYARRLRPRYRTGIISNSFVGATEREQAAYGFGDLVGEIVYSHECGMSKPDPGIYALACDRLRVEPAQMVFLDDSGNWYSLTQRTP